jgi:hypothetical protein
MTKTFNISINEPSARPGNWGKESIRVRLIETPTNIKPAKVAAALALTIKKLFHSFIIVIC